MKDELVFSCGTIIFFNQRKLLSYLGHIYKYKRSLDKEANGLKRLQIKLPRRLFVNISPYKLKIVING
jgi:hypothetical protein